MARSKIPHDERPGPIAVYLSAGDQIIENVTMGYFYFQDSLGNTSHVTDSVGNLLERYTYDAFGRPTILSTNNTQLSTSAYGIRHLFQGQLWTQETGLNDYRNRVELPLMGVFLQPDPIGFKGDAANIYRVCNNNAVNRIDPMGLDYEIDHQGNNYVFTLGIHYYPENSAVTRMSETEAIFNKAIETGVHGDFLLSDGRTVKVATRVISSYMNSVGIYEGHGASKTSVNDGHWMNQGLPVSMGGTPEFTALHEALHLLGVKDHYDKINGRIVPRPGYENDVMGGVKGGVSAADIEEIIKSNGKGVSGRVQGCSLIQRAIANSSTDVRWAQGSGTGNWQADQTTKDYLLSGGENGGEGFHPRGPN